MGTASSRNGKGKKCTDTGCLNDCRVAMGGQSDEGGGTLTPLTFLLPIYFLNLDGYRPLNGP